MLASRSFIHAYMMDSNSDWIVSNSRRHAITNVYHSRNENEGKHAVGVVWSAANTLTYPLFIGMPVGGMCIQFFHSDSS